MTSRTWQGSCGPRLWVRNLSQHPVGYRVGASETSEVAAAVVAAAAAAAAGRSPSAPWLLADPKWGRPRGDEGPWKLSTSQVPA